MNTDTQEFLAGLRRRRTTSLRLPPLHCGHADNWGCRCSRRTLTTESALAAADHLLHHGLAPLFDIEQARILWRAGHRDHAAHCTQQVSA